MTGEFIAGALVMAFVCFIAYKVIKSRNKPRTGSGSGGGGGRTDPPTRPH